MADEQLNQAKIQKTSVPKENKKVAEAPVKNKPLEEVSKEEINTEKKVEEVKDVKTEVKETKEEKKKIEVKKVKRSEASVYGRNLRISLKQSKAIGRFIKFKKIDESINNLEKVVKKKIAIPFKGEVAHRKGTKLSGKGMMSGKYPIVASKEFIKLLKSLNSNSSSNGMDLEKTRITEVVMNKAPKQLHRFGGTQFKRTHVLIRAKEMTHNKMNKGDKK